MGQHSKKNKKKELSNAFYMKVCLLLGVALVLFSLYSIFQSSSLENLLDQRIAEAKQATIPAKITLITIQDSDCADCFNITPLVDSVRKSNINITDEQNLELSNDKAKDLIDKYNIEKIPTILLLGEIDKTQAGVFEQVDDALVFTKLVPPYTDAKSGRVMGMVSAVFLKDSSCDLCTDISPLLGSLKQVGIRIVSEETVEMNSRKGQDLIDEYDIKTLPVLIFSNDLDAYGPTVTDNLKQAASVEEDGSYVTRIKIPPYLDLATEELVGLVAMTVIVDQSCQDCYDPDDLHKPTLERMGVVFIEEKRIDISSSEGKSLIKKYDIDKVPTIVLEGDMDEYSSLTNAWIEVGTVESDGTYVFRGVDIIGGTYKDLITNEVVEPSAQV